MNNNNNNFLAFTILLIAAMTFSLILFRYNSMSSPYVIIGIIIILSFIFPNTNQTFISQEEQTRRKAALFKAKSFLTPYSKNFGNHTLSNKYCTVIFTNQKNENKFVCISKFKAEKTGIPPFFEVVIMENIAGTFPTANECFDALCINFSYRTTLDDLYAIFSKQHNSYNNYILNDSGYTKEENKSKKNTNLVNFIKNTNKKKDILLKTNINQIETININNASEAELTALPGINLIQAKKIIKFRDFEREFTSVEDFFNIIKIKKHFQEPLKSKIKVEPIKKNTEKSPNKRIVDIE